MINSQDVAPADSGRLQTPSGMAGSAVSWPGNGFIATETAQQGQDGGSPAFGTAQPPSGPAAALQPPQGPARGDAAFGTASPASPFGIGSAVDPQPLQGQVGQADPGRQHVFQNLFGQRSAPAFNDLCPSSPSSPVVTPIRPHFSFHGVQGPMVATVEASGASGPSTADPGGAGLLDKPQVCRHLVRWQCHGSLCLHFPPWSCPQKRRGRGIWCFRNGQI